MQFHKLAACTWALILITVALAIAAYSTHLNFRFGAEYFGGQVGLAANLFGAGLVSADIAKYVLVASIGPARIQHRYLTATAYGVLVAVAAFTSIAAMANMGMQGLEATSGTSRAHTRVLADMKAERARLSAERATMGTLQPPAAIEARIGALRHDRRWSSSEGCTRATTSASRALCADHQTLFSQLAGAQRAEQLGIRIDQLTKRIQKATTTEVFTDQRRGITAVAELLGVSPVTVALINLVGLAMLLEALGIAVWGLAATHIRGLLGSPPAPTTPALEPIRGPGLNDHDDYSDLTDESDRDEAFERRTIIPQAVQEMSVPTTGQRTQATTPSAATNVTTFLPRQSADCVPTAKSGNVVTSDLGSGDCVVPLLTTRSAPAAATAATSRVHLEVVNAPPSPVSFWDTCTVPDKGARLRASVLYRSYVAWCQERCIHPLAQLTFAKCLTAARKPRRRRVAAGNVYVGIRLRGAMDCVGVGTTKPAA